MNKKIESIIKEYHLHPISYVKKGNILIINEKNKSYVLKLNTSNYDIYKYLESRNFINIPDYYSKKDDNFELREYIFDINVKKDQRINDLIEILSILHNKTSYLRDLDLDEIKEIYENTKRDINNTKDYYLKLNDLIDKEIFFSPSMYLLVKNISLIYYLLSYAENKVNSWYKNILNEKGIRVALLHNNVSINHLIINNNKYLISWDKSYFNSPIYDIESFYRKYYFSINLNDALKIYEKKNKLNPLEIDLLLTKLSIPKIIELTNNTYNDTIKINREINYLNKIYMFVKQGENEKNLLNN